MKKKKKKITSVVLAQRVNFRHVTLCLDFFNESLLIVLQNVDTVYYIIIITPPRSHTIMTSVKIRISHKIQKYNNT